MPMAVLASVAGGMAVWLGLHVAVWRARPSNAPRMALLGGLSVIGLAVSLASGAAMRATALEGWAILWMDLFVIIAYGFIYAGLARSVSITVLARLRRCGGQPLSLEALAGEYAASSRFEDRLRVMHDTRWIELSGRAVRLTPQGARLGRMAWMVSRALGGRLHG